MKHVDVLSLHRINGSTLAASALGGGRGEEANVNILVLDQLLELRQDLRLNKLLTLGGALSVGSSAVLLQLAESREAIVRNAAKDVNEDGV